MITLLLGTLAAYGLARSSSRLRGPLALLFFLPITLPGLFIGIALLVAFSRVQFTLSLVTVTIAHLVYVFPFFFLIARAALERLDPALEETASDLGANRWTVFRRVTIPQVWPMLVGRRLPGLCALLRRVRDHLLRHRPRLDAAAVHLVEPAAHDRPEHQRDLLAAAGCSRCCCS